MERGTRYPRVSSLMEAEPFKIYPVCVHPVLGGETIRNLYIDGRVHLNGVKGTIQGWYLDLMYCYVKVRDIDEELVDMFVDPDWSVPAAFQAPSTSRDTGEQTGSERIAWASLATSLIYKYYIARETEHYHGGLPLAPIKYPGAFQNFYELAEDTSSALMDDPGILQTMIEDVDNYADVLERYGIRGAAIRRLLPEILLWRSYHNYPVLAPIDDNNEIINRNMCLWSPRESRATKKGIFITEPGFIIGLAFYRPDIVEYNKKSWQSTKWINGTDWFVPPYELSDGIGQIGGGSFDHMAYVADMHYNKFDTWMNGETHTNIDPDGASATQLTASVAKTPEVDVGFTDIRTDYPRQGAASDLDTYIPNLLHADYYCGMSLTTRMSIRTPLVI